MNYTRGPSYLLALTLLVAACGPSETIARSQPERDAIAVATPISGPRPANGSYRQRYLSNIAPMIVDCMNDLGWEATYEPHLGVLLSEIPLSQVLERDGAMRFCVSGSLTYRGIHAD